MKKNERIILASIENFKDVTNPENAINGTLSLVQQNDAFYIYWSSVEEYPNLPFICVFDDSKPRADMNSWSRGKSYQIKCNDISDFSLTDSNPIIISFNCKIISGRYQIDNNEHISLIMFIEQLFIHGIVVPSIRSRFSLQFYPNCHTGTYHYIPSHIHITAKSFSMTSEIWPYILNFFEKLIIHLYETGTIPPDINYPLNEAARAVHNRILDAPNKYMKTIPEYEPLTVNNFKDIFDSEGRIIDPQSFKHRLFFRKFDKELLPEIIPFATGLYKFDSTYEERKKQDELYLSQYNVLYEQVSLILPEQVTRNKKLSDSFRIITHDVMRTDRTTLPFKKDTAPALGMLTTLLRLYSVYNPPIGYLQGMNDLMVPFITGYILNWSDDCIPLDENKQPLDYEKLMPKIFWSFDAMIANINQGPMLRRVTETCAEVSEEVIQLLEKVSPVAAIWIKFNKLQNMMWFFTDYVLIFKRSIDDIWPTWMQFNCAPDPTTFLLYFTTAMLCIAFDQFAALPEISDTSAVTSFPQILTTLDAHEVGVVALWIYEHYPYQPKYLHSKSSQNSNASQSNFEFFHYN